jgi:hypothetical protein
MNRILLTTVLAAGLANSVFGQGLFLSNIGNTGGSAASAGGLVYTFWSGPIHPVDLYNNDLGVEIFYGLTSDSLSPLGLGTYTAATGPKGYTGWDIGQFCLGNFNERIVVPGAKPGGSVWIQLKMWLDGPYGMPNMFNSYYEAGAGGAWQWKALWLQPLDGGGSPPSGPGGFTMMPSLFPLDIPETPEPSTFMLSCLGIGATWLLRRRK